LECGGSTPLSFFLLGQGKKKESGVEPPHSKNPCTETEGVSQEDLGKT